MRTKGILVHTSAPHLPGILLGRDTPVTFLGWPLGYVRVASGRDMSIDWLKAGMNVFMWFMLLNISAYFWHEYRQSRGDRRAQAGRCAECGYDLRGSPIACPECGRAVETAR